MNKPEITYTIKIINRQFPKEPISIVVNAARNSLILDQLELRNPLIQITEDYMVRIMDIISIERNTQKFKSEMTSWFISRGTGKELEKGGDVS